MEEIPISALKKEIARTGILPARFIRGFGLSRRIFLLLRVRIESQNKWVAFIRRMANNGF
jgi:hypothetical protein